MTADARYLVPDRFTEHVMNPLVAWLARRGVSLAGSAELAVVGRSSGQVRTTPVNPLTLDGARYLVAPRGTTHWVRNLRAAGTAELRVGRRRETVVATEVTGDEQVPVLRAYLRQWAWEVGMFFDGVDARSDDATLRDVGPRHPVFRIERAG